MLKVRDLSLQLSSASRDEQKADVLNNLSYEFLNSSLERSEDYALEALELSMQLDYPKGLVEAYANLGRIYCRSSKNTESIKYFNQAIDLCKSNSLSVLLGRTYGDISTVYRITGDLDQSLKYAVQGLEFLPPDEDTEGFRAMNLNCIGNIYHQQGKIDEAYECYREGIKILSEVGDRRTAVNMRGNLAVLLSSQKKHEEAIEQFNICLEDFRLISHRQGESVTMVNIAFEYYNQKAYPKSLNHFLKAIKLLKVVENKKSLVNAYRGLGLVYVAFNGYDEAIKHINKSVQLARDVNYAYGIYLGLMVLGEAFSKKEDHESAMQFYNEALQLAKEKNWEYTGLKEAWAIETKKRQSALQEA